MAAWGELWICEVLDHKGLGYEVLTKSAAKLGEREFRRQAALLLDSAGVCGDPA